MKLVTHVSEALSNFFSSKLRSILALIGILVGTASVVTMISTGELATNEALRQFKVLGTDLLSVNISQADEMHPTLSQRNFTLQEALDVNSADNQIKKVAPYTQLYSTAQFNGQPLNGSILGVTDSFTDVAAVGVEKGRFISLLDNYGLFCVIGSHIANELKKLTFRDPVGLQIKIGENIFTIVGVAKPWLENSFVYTNVDYSILIPLLTSLALSKHTSINNIIFRLEPNANIDQVKHHTMSYITSYLGEKNLTYRSAKELLARMAKQSQILTLFLGLIGSVSLIVGGIGVMNIMLVSVVERRREIGIRMAVGAQRLDICGLFLVEAVMLALVGGSLGILIGLLIAYTIALLSDWQFYFLWFPALVGFTVSAATGIFFGFYPAYQASALNPIEALRSE